MKFSQAIRLGAMLNPQSRGARDSKGGTCALVAAIEAMSCDGLPDEFSAIRSLWPWSRDDLQICPACNNNVKTTNTALVCAHLNDDHRWTRESISDWVATVEPQQEELAPPTAPIHEEANETV